MAFYTTSTPRQRTYAFDLAAAGLLAGAVLHLGAWIGGPLWMAALGAPPSIVASAAVGSWPALLGTLAICALLVGLALCCFLATRRWVRSILLRVTLTTFSIIFLARGSLAVPFALSGQREWRTPLGHFMITGQWFVAGSLVVLSIGALIGFGLYQTRLRPRALATDQALTG